MFAAVIAFLRQHLSTGVTIQQVAEEFGISLRKARRLLTYYRGQGLLTEVRQRHNRGFWVPALAGGSPEAEVARKRSPAEIRELLRRPKVDFRFDKRYIRNSSNSPNKRVEKPLSKRKSTFPPRGKHLPLPRRPQEARFPADGCRDRVLALEGLWTTGLRSLLHAPRRSLFTSRRPWNDPADQTQIKRWNQFVRLDARLREWRVPPDQFVAAAMDYFRRAGGYITVQRVIGTKGKVMWDQWYMRHELEGRGWVDSETGLLESEVERRREAAARMTPEEVWIERDLREAYVACRELGAENAASFSWRKEVAWVLAKTEPAVEAAYKVELLRDEPRLKAMQRGFWAGQIEMRKAPEQRRRWLIALRNRIAGCPGPTLAMPEPELPPPRMVDEAEYEHEAQMERAMRMELEQEARR